MVEDFEVLEFLTFSSYLENEWIVILPTHHPLQTAKKQHLMLKTSHFGLWLKFNFGLV